MTHLLQIQQAKLKSTHPYLKQRSQCNKCHNDSTNHQFHALQTTTTAKTKSFSSWFQHWHNNNKTDNSNNQNTLREINNENRGRWHYIVSARGNSMTTAGRRSLTWKLQLGPSRCFILFLPQERQHKFNLVNQRTSNTTVERCNDIFLCFLDVKDNQHSWADWEI
jgi:hypothetical protein